MSDIDNQALQNIWEVLLAIQDAIEALNPERFMSQTCQHHRCEYFTDYLAKGPADLTHEGYHAAEDENEKLQAKYPGGIAGSQWEERLRL